MPKPRRLKPVTYPGAILPCLVVFLLCNVSFGAGRFAAPATPTSFTVTARAYGDVLISWQADGNEDHVEVDRAPFSGSCGSFTNLGRTNRSDDGGHVDLVHPSGHSGLSLIDDTVAANTTYCYRARATNADGNSSYTSAVQVTTANPAATPVANAGPDRTVNLGEVVGLDGAASTGLDTDPSRAVSWDFGDGRGTPYSVSKVALKPAHLYLMAGVYTVRLTITNSSGATSTDTAQVTVNPVPAPKAGRLFNMGAAVNACGTDAACYINPATDLSDCSGNKTKFLQALSEANTASSAGHVRIVIPDGACLNGDITLAARSNNNYIQIYSASAHAGAFSTGTRVTTTQAASMPYFYAYADSINPVMSGAGRKYYDFRGVKFTQANSAIGVFAYLWLGDNSAETSYASASHHFIVMHCAFLQPSGGHAVNHALFSYASDVTVADSLFLGIRHTGSDSQAIAHHVGNRVAVVNNLLEGSTENIIVGGTTPGIQDAVPESITFKRNYFHKPIEWFPGNTDFVNGSYAGTEYSVKNIFELKSGREILVAGNYLLRSWSSGQHWAVILRAGSDSGNAQTESIWFAYNKVESVSQWIETIGYENFPRGLRRVLIEQNLVLDIDPRHWWGPDADDRSGDADVFIAQGQTDVQFVHNSLVRHPSPNLDETGVLFNRPAWTAHKIQRFVWKNNAHYTVDTDGYYFWNADTAQTGTTGLSNSTTFAPAAVYVGNLYASQTASPPMPTSGNYFVLLSDYAAQFDDYAGGVYSIDSSSPAHNGATDGTDSGVNFADVSNAVTGSVLGNWGPVAGASTAPVRTRGKVKLRGRLKAGN